MLCSELWERIQDRLNEGRPNWRDWINNEAGQVTAILNRENGRKFTDKEIWEGIVKVVLSNNTD